MVEEIINQGAMVTLPDIVGWTALHVACFYKRADVILLLLKNGANLLTKDRDKLLACDLVLDDPDCVEVIANYLTLLGKKKINNNKIANNNFEDNNQNRNSMNNLRIPNILDNNPLNLSNNQELGEFNNQVTPTPNNQINQENLETNPNLTAEYNSFWKKENSNAFKNYYHKRKKGDNKNISFSEKNLLEFAQLGQTNQNIRDKYKFIPKKHTFCNLLKKNLKKMSSSPKNRFVAASENFELKNEGTVKKMTWDKSSTPIKKENSQSK